MSRRTTVSVYSMRRSASVDLPWSMWAMIEKLRMRDWGRESVTRAMVREAGAIPDRPSGRSVRSSAPPLHRKPAVHHRPAMARGEDADLAGAQRCCRPRRLVGVLAVAAWRGHHAGGGDRGRVSEAQRGRAHQVEGH